LSLHDVDASSLGFLDNPKKTLQFRNHDYNLMQQAPTLRLFLYYKYVLLALHGIRSDKLHGTHQ